MQGYGHPFSSRDIISEMRQNARNPFSADARQERRSSVEDLAQLQELALVRLKHRNGAQSALDVVFQRSRSVSGHLVGGA